MADAEIAYLNHAGTSWPKPPSVQQAVAAAQQMSPLLWSAMLEESHEAVSEFFHVSPSRLLLTPSCTAALGIAMQDHPWQEGDCIITSHFEHHALHRHLIRLADQGVTVHVLSPTAESLIDLTELESVLKSRTVRLVAMTAACNVTGALLPMEDVIRLAHDYGSQVLVDGAQIAGWWDLDLKTLGADLFTFAGHKGLQSPWGLGGLYVSDQMPMKCSEAVCEQTPEPPTRKTDNMPGYCDVGSVNLNAVAGLAAACWWLNEPAQRDRLTRARKLARQLADLLRPLEGVRLLHDMDEDRRMPAVAIAIAGQPSALIAHRLKQFSVVASGGFHCAPQAHHALQTSEYGAVRFSFGPSSTFGDVERAAAAMQEILSAAD